jgi:hypothetical protein
MNFMNVHENLQENENNRSDDYASSYATLESFATYVVPGFIGHLVGYAVELGCNYGFRKYLPDTNHNWAFSVIGVVMHEGVENIISSGSIINLMNLNSLKESMQKAFEPIYTETGKFISAATCSYLAEKALNTFMHGGHDHGHDHAHSPLGIGLSAILSVAGATVGIVIYDYFAGE